MMTFAELRRRAWYFLHRNQAARDLEEEMRLHIALRAQSLRTASSSVAQRLPGAERAALASAQLQFGNRTQLLQRSQDAWGFSALESLRNDMQFAFRRLLKQRAFSAAVIVVMAIGIGATTAMFSAVDATLLRPLPFFQPDKLVMLPLQVPFQGGSGKRHSYQTNHIGYEQVSQMHDLFSYVAAYAVGGLNLSDEQHPIRVKTGVVTADFFRTLGAEALVGRTFSPGDGAPGTAYVAVLSYALWKNQFGAQAISALHLKLNSHEYRAVGVMPPQFGFPEQSDVWIPMSVPNTIETFEAFREIVLSTTIARLADNVNVATASAQLLSRFEQTDPAHTPQEAELYATLRKRGIAVPLKTMLASARSTTLYVLMTATGLLLLIACANVMNLMLAQASVRRREIAMRQVLGATHTRIVRQLMMESIVLSLAGAVVGMVVAWSALKSLSTLMPTTLSGIASLQIDWRILTFAIAVACVSSIAFGLWPALSSARQSSAESIKSGGGHGATSANSGRVRRMLVGAELALTIMLLTGAGVMLRSLQNILDRNMGMNPAHVGTMEVAFPMSMHIPERTRKIDAILAQLSSAPGIVAAGASKTLPLAGGGELFVGISVDGVDSKSIDYGKIGMTFDNASPGYFAAMGIRVLQGRTFNDSDNSATHPGGIINATVAKLYWPKGDALGSTFRMMTDSTPITVVGVVADVTYHLGDDPVMQIYHPIHLDMPFVASFVARGNMGDAATLKAMTTSVKVVDASQPVFHLRTMDEIREASVAPRRTSAQFIFIFAMFALLLASVGVYAVVSYSVTQRNRELGIRSALGATGRNLITLISREMLWVVVAGVLFGITGAWVGARYLDSLVYGVAAHDPLTFAMVPLALLLPVAAATALPALRMLRINPAQVMRAE